MEVACFTKLITTTLHICWKIFTPTPKMKKGV